MSRKKQYFFIPLAACIAALPLFFTATDSKIFDIFLRSLPTLTESEKVYVLTLDDDSIEYAGGFPFRREVMADVTVLLRELGVKSIAFDLNYLDSSPQRLDRGYALQVFSRYLDDGFGSINDTASRIIDGFASGQISGSGSEIYRDEFLELNRTVRSGLENSLVYLTRDVDEYFSQALGFSGCSNLALTMLRDDHVLAGGKLPEPGRGTLTLIERFALGDIDAAADSKTPEMAGIMPSIPKLLRRAKGAGFVNADPDKDGLRRRIHLLARYRGKYYGHLTLTGTAALLGNPAIEVSDSVITLKGASINGVKSNIRIPRARDGSMLLKWPKKSFYDYRIMSLLELIQHTIIEQAFTENISLMNSSGFFAFWDGAANPLDRYNAAEKLKTEIVTNADTETTAEHWLTARGAFFSASEQFLFGGYEEMILASVSTDTATAGYVRELFGASREQFLRMKEIREEAAVLKDSLCVIGSDATSMTDEGITTFEENFPNTGTYAVAANMLLSGEFIDDAPLWISACIMVVFAFGITFLIIRLPTGRSMAAGTGALAVLITLLLIYFRITKQYIDAAVPLAASTLTFLSITLINFLGTSREKAFLQNAFSRYLSPEVINEIIADPSKLNLGGEKRDMTALFTDIQGFSTLSEQLDPAHLVRLLNRYLTLMSNIVMENQGTIDKYEGDAIIAFFGAPVHRKNHAELACRSALAMKQAERELNKVIMEERLSPAPLFTRIGINSGDMVVGNMGAEKKMDYTIMGNAVNLAARLEGVNKLYHTNGILISEYTRSRIGEEFVCRCLDRVRVVGINTPLRLYELLGIMPALDSAVRDKTGLWEQGIIHFEQRRFAQAMEMFSAAALDSADHTAGLYIKRCAGFIENPPPGDWDAVNYLTDK
ncbi:MAG: CHASE2 domain-containing protein [Treponema sp.]|jgi:adenylate cyclase|nr:CHASE2 domain-containing protein [Treponema sp.]